jgi:hypothetical protein
MNPSVRKWVIRPLLILLIVFTVLAGIGFLLLTTQQQRLVNMAVQEMNKQFKGELTIEESSISLFKNFPYVSIALHNARFYPDKTKTGTPICRIDRLYAGFSLTDLFREKYDVKRLVAHGGEMDLVREADGKLNLLEAGNFQSDITSQIKQDPRASRKQSFGEIDLEKIVIQEMNISLLDNSNGRKFSTYINTLTSHLTLDSCKLTFTVHSAMELDFVTDSDTTFFRHKRFMLEGEADYKTDTKLFEITTCNFKLEEAEFSVHGSANFGDQKQVDLRVKGDKQDFNLLSAFLPEDVKEKLKPFQYDGRLYFDGRLKGNVAEDQLPLIEISFGCEDAWVLNTGAGKKVDQLGFRGYYTNGSEHNLRTSEVHIMNVNARPEKGIFKGNFVVRNFTHPHTLVQIRSELELKFLGDFFGIRDLKQITGKIKLDMDFKELSDIQLPEESLNKLKEGIQSKLVVENLSFRIPGYAHPVQDMNIHAEMKNGRITLDSAFLRIGDSDLRLDGSLSDIRAFLRDHHKPIKLALNAKSDQLILKELLAYDTALARKMKEEVKGFNVRMTMETTVDELLHPTPLPRGTFEMKNLRGAFKIYPHTFRDMSGTVIVSDTTLRLRNLTGMIDSSDIQFSGRIHNFHLWFDKIKKGKTNVAFDFKSKRFAMQDVLSPDIREYIPRGYRREEANNVWLRMKFDLKYDTIFRFAKGHITHIIGDLKKHQLKLKDVHGSIKYGARLLALDTLQGTIGRSDFNISLKYFFTGYDREMKKRSNSLKFTSSFLDLDEMSHYDLAPRKGRKKATIDSLAIASNPDSAQHAQAFNIFKIPFSDFEAEIDVGKVKYNRLWLKDVTARLHMQENQHIYIDTLRMKVAGGTMAMRGHFNGMDHEKIYFRSRINVDQLDLEKLMVKFDHFGQDVVVNKNIKGRLSGQIKSYIQVHPNLVPIISKTKAELNIKIFNGSLIDFAPMQAMSTYFKDKNLRMIRFDTLQNKLTFTDGVLDIPSMNINSSLGFIKMSGKQSLDLTMEYYVRVPMKMVTHVGLSSLFARKPEEVDLNQVDEIEYLDKDKKIAFMNLKVTGKPQDFKVGLGKDKTRN